MNKRQSSRNKREIAQENGNKKIVNYKENDSDSEDEISLAEIKQKESKKKKQSNTSDSDNDGSSSDSSVGDYLKAADEIDLNSTFFNTTANNEKLVDFESIEKNIFSGIQRLSDSESDKDENIAQEFDDTTNNKDTIEDKQNEETETTRINFSQLREYDRKIEEAKACIEKYKESKQSQKKKMIHKTYNLDVSHLLSVGEAKNESQTSIELDDNVFDSDDEMEWEEINDGIEKADDTVKIPKEGLEITVQLPSHIRKQSKEVDYMAVIKRRMNRIKKENQVFVHKVHLLCWIAHGNLLNTVLNNETLMGMALSLLPSEQCYPPKHADLTYLEQIVKWYGKLMKISEKSNEENQVPLEEALRLQFGKKKVNSKRDLIFIFILILRSLGLQCRLILSFQIVSLRPPNSELFSLSTKDNKNKTEDEKSENNTDKNKIEDLSKPGTSKINKDNTKASSSKSKTNTKSKSDKLNKSITVNAKTVKLNSSKVEAKANKKSSKNKKSSVKSSKISDIKISQVDGADDSPSTSRPKKAGKPSIRIKLKNNLDAMDSESNTCISSKHSRKSKEKLPHTVSSDDDFKPKISKTSIEMKSPKDGNSKNKNTASNSNKEKLKSSEITSPRDINSNRKKYVASSSNNKEQLAENKDGISDKKKKIIESISSDKYKLDVSKNKRSISPKVVTSKSQNGTSCSTSKDKHEVRKSVASVSKDEEKINPTKVQKTSTNQKSPKDINVNKKVHAKKLSNSEKAKTPSTVKKGMDVRNDIINLLKDQMSQERHLVRNKLVRRKPESDYESDYDSDYAPEIPVKKRKSKTNDSDEEFKAKLITKVKPRVKPRSQLEAEAKTDKEDAEKKKPGQDIWIEVFLEAEEKWISVDLIKGHFHCISELNKQASQPISYIVAWDNNFSIKDVTARYCPNWNTVTRKLRVDPTWWNQTLKPFMGKKTVRDREEDEDLARQQLDQPLPKAISEYKNHPLYALKRHLLKFEAIYPPDAVTLGFIRDEAVYARECIHVLHSRELWVKQAKVVKLGEQPYKIVKKRPKYDKLSGKMITDLPLEIFGIWQVEDYVPPTAENGVVPRNPFGNVELFKACMLPKKTVHLKLPGLNKVARKLNIDCAPAMIGFDFHAGGNHPVYDGYVVCEEFEEVLVAAWEEERIESIRREREKIEKRVYGNWRKLIRGLLIRERLKVKYDFGESSGKSNGPKVDSKKRRIYSDDENAE